HPLCSLTLPLSLHDALPIWMLAMFHSGTSPASGVVIAAPVLGMDRWSGRSSTGECPCVLPVLLIAVVVVVDGRLGPVVRQRVLRSEEHTSELQSRFALVCRL